MMEVAGVVAGPRSSVTVLMNGGQIAYTDVAASLSSGRPGGGARRKRSHSRRHCQGASRRGVGTTVPSRSRPPL